MSELVFDQYCLYRSIKNFQCSHMKGLDRLVLANDQHHKVQVKTAKVFDGRTTYMASIVRGNGRFEARKYKAAEVDFFFIVHPKDQSAWVIPFDVLSRLKSNVYLNDRYDCFIEPIKPTKDSKESIFFQYNPPPPVDMFPAASATTQQASAPSLGSDKCFLGSADQSTGGFLFI